MRTLLVLLVTLALVPLVPASALADPCEEFTWNVAHERSLFAGPPVQLATGKDAASAPQIALDRLYQLALAPRSDVHLALPAGHKPRDDGNWSGLLRLRITAPGLYRVSLSEGDWIDVVREGAQITSENHQGRSGCNAPHKVVQFRLSGASAATVRLTVTSTPPNADTAK